MPKITYEIDKFLKTHKTTKTTEEEIENLNRPRTSKVIVLVIFKK